MRREELYLRDICEASDSIARFILGLTRRNSASPTSSAAPSHRSWP